MHARFWEERWQTGQIGFHLPEVNPLLVAFHDQLPPGGRVLVPLCGKSLDLVWLSTKGHEVVGVELVGAAILDFFREQALPFVPSAGPPPGFASGPLTLLNADVLALRREDVGTITGVWDRAALVALAADVRPAYAHALAALAPGATMLLVTFVHELGGGPPFSIADDEVRALYASGEVSLIDERDGVPSPSMLAKGMKNLVEHTWRIVLPQAEGQR